MKQQQIQKRAFRVPPQPLDLRAPSGRLLPF
jgi:hypothetical protein